MLNERTEKKYIELPNYVPEGKINQPGNSERRKGWTEQVEKSKGGEKDWGLNETMYKVIRSRQNIERN